MHPRATTMPPEYDSPARGDIQCAALFGPNRTYSKTVVEGCAAACRCVSHMS